MITNDTSTMITNTGIDPTEVGHFFDVLGIVGRVFVFTDGPRPEQQTMRAARLVAALVDGRGSWWATTSTFKIKKRTAANAEQVHTLTLDLDVKPGGLPDNDTAHGLIAELSAVLGTEPAAVVASGHGWQPHWSIADGTDTNTAAVLQRRLWALADQLATRHGGAVDPAYGVERVWRLPGTVNLKDPAVPVTTWASYPGGRALTLAEVAAALDAAGLVEPTGRAGRLTVSGPAVTDAEVDRFVEDHAGSSRVELLDVIMGSIDRVWRDNPHYPRHELFTRWLPAAARESAVGCYPARVAFERLWARWKAAEGQGPGRLRSEDESASEFGDLVAWAVGQATASDPAETLERIEQLDEPTLTFRGFDHPIGSVPASNGQHPPDAGEPAEGEPAADPVETAVEGELRKLRIRAEARRRFDVEVAPDPRPFDVVSVRTMLTRPAGPDYQVANLIPSASSSLIVAQRKTGKTTLTVNLARSLLLGLPFLGRFATRPVTGPVVILNYEVSGQQLARWFNDAGVDPDRAIMVNLRGEPNPFGTDRDRARLADRLREIGPSGLLVDPFGAAYTGESENDAAQVRRFLDGLDRFARAEVGAELLFVTAHAGWGGQDASKGARGRGSSALEDWPDSVVALTRGDDGERYLSAFGRDVEVAEDRLIFDPVTRLLTLSGEGGRTAQRVAELRQQILRYVVENPGVSGNGIQQGVGGNSAEVRDSVKALVEAGALVAERRGRGVFYTANPAHSTYSTTFDQSDWSNADRGSTDLYKRSNQRSNEQTHPPQPHSTRSNPEQVAADLLGAARIDEPDA